jgi:hypothetical protein
MVRFNPGINMKFTGSARWVFAGLMSVTSVVCAQNLITALSVGYNSSTTVIKIDLARPPAKLPDTELISGKSPYIALEFSDTANGLGESVQNFTEGGVRNVNIIQSGERTRLVLYLNQMFPYNIRIDGNSLLIALQGNAGDADNIALRTAVSRQDAQRQALQSEAEARRKAQQIIQAAEEEKAKQVAAAKAAKIQAEEEAKAEAMRVKAEQQAKIKAAALAKQAAKAETARLKAEQKAKAEAEKQAAAEAQKVAKAEAARLKAEQEAQAKTVAEEKAKREAEAKAAKLKAWEEAKAEAKRLKAEQKAKAEAEKQAAALARQTAEAEAARLVIEQKAKAKTEKQATALARQTEKIEVAKPRAKWVMVGENRILALTAYANPDTEATLNKGRNENKNGDKVKMWRMYDYKSTQEASGYKFISAKFMDEYDCKQEQTRSLVNTAFSENMGGGVVIFTNADTGKWQPVMGGINKALLKFACGKK